MTKKILFIGDSITDGNRYKDVNQRWDLNHQMGHSYAYIINALLGSGYPSKDLTFVNRGVSGDRIVDIYSRLEKDILHEKADIISILVGVNDGPTDKNANSPTPIWKFDKLYRMLLDEILEVNKNVKFVICEPFFLETKKKKEEMKGWAEIIQGFSEKAKKIAEDYNCVFVPLQKEFNKACKLKEAEYWIWDSIHPTENGHGLIAKKWLECSQDLVLE